LRDVVKVLSSKNRLTNKHEISLTGSKLKVNENKKVSSKGKDMNGANVEIVQYNDKEMLVKYPLINISPIPPRTFNIRVIIWNAESVPAMDMGGTSDAYVKAWCTSHYYEKVTKTKALSTDVHWFCNTGCPNWNWRFTWD